MRIPFSGNRSSGGLRGPAPLPLIPFSAGSEEVKKARKSVEIRIIVTIRKIALKSFRAQSNRPWDPGTETPRQAAVTQRCHIGLFLLLISVTFLSLSSCFGYEPRIKGKPDLAQI
jgi:hypothetical protein